MTRRTIKYTDEVVDQIVEDVDEAIDQGRFTVTYPRRGRPSLSGEAAESPIVGFRITPELRSRAQNIAMKEGLSLSELARKALQEYLRRA